jgi:protocatechuate 3,4-dioxygenase beta subunit
MYLARWTSEDRNLAYRATLLAVGYGFLAFMVLPALIVHAMGETFTLASRPIWLVAACAMRPPHIHFEIHGQLERLITQMYFPGEPLNTCDRLLNAVLRPDLLIATCLSPQDPPDRRVLSFDIVLSRG